jgi:hypothetical protein
VDVEHGIGGFSVGGLRGSRDVYDAKHGVLWYGRTHADSLQTEEEQIGSTRRL